MESLYFLIIKIFQLACFVLALYMSYLQFSRYQANGDISIVSFRTFNNEKQDVYPSYSMCVKGPNGEIFKEDKIHSIWNDVEYHKAARMYQDVLRGGGNFSTEIVKMNFDNLTIDFFDVIFESIQTHTKDGDIHHDHLPLSFSYQDTKYICITRDVKFENDFLINKEQVMLNPEMIANQSLSLSIYLHQSGGLTQSLLSGQEPLIEFKYQDFLELFAMYEEFYGAKSFYTADVRINQVEVLRKRANSVVPCHDAEDLQEDFEWILKVTSEVGCVPIFWKRMFHENMKPEVLIEINECTDALQYSKIDNFTSLYNVMRKINPSLRPCTKTSIFASVDIYYVSNEDQHEFLLKISHINEEYKETLNIRGFDEETLLSTVGGYIGIFLGYSLLQLPAILSDIFSRKCIDKKQKRPSKCCLYK